MLYFDHNATTFVAPEVADTMAAAVRQVFGNASSTHREGQLSRHQLEKSRQTVAEFLHASPADFVFTSGGTESNNLAIRGLLRKMSSARPHVITATIEHPSVLESCRELEREGVDVSYVGVNSEGLLDVDEIRRSIRPETMLISVMHANNEVGTIQPIREIAEVVRERRDAGQVIFFHADGVQAFGKIESDVQQLGVDLYSISGHKIFAPKGIGGLYVRKGTPLRGIQFGGRHERERRAGTENVPGAMAVATAVELCASASDTHLSALRDYFEAEVRSRLGDIEVNGAINSRLPNTSNLLFRSVSAEALVIALDMKDVAVSTGSACSSGSVEPSHVLLAMGRSHQEARSSVRFSMGRYNTAEDVRTLIETVVVSVLKLRIAARWEKPVLV